MRIKRIEAATVAEAMRRLREDLGDDALILHTKTITAPGVAGFFKRTRVEILGAVDENLRPPEASRGAEPRPSFSAHLRSEPSSAPPLQQLPLQVIRPSGGGFELVPPSVASPRATITERLRSFRAAVPATPLPSPDDAHPAPAGASAVAAHGPFEWARLGRRARRIVFVGPTGAGKTTTLAKVAARAQLDHGQRVALVTIDTYRIGAVPQLASYAEILGVSLGVAQSPAEVADAIADAHDADLVFIDTTGRSPLGAGVEGLKPFLEAAAPDITYLVLSAITRARDALRAADSYGRLTPNALCVTRLDETDDYQSLTEVVHTTGLPLAWLGIGQEVPDDIKEADAASLAALARGEHAA